MESAGMSGDAGGAEASVRASGMLIEPVLNGGEKSVEIARLVCGRGGDFENGNGVKSDVDVWSSHRLLSGIYLLDSPPYVAVSFPDPCRCLFLQPELLIYFDSAFFLFDGRHHSHVA